MTKHTLKIEDHDVKYGRGAQASMIRIKGKWLTKAGFPPGASVELTVISAGVIELRLCAPPQLVAEDFKTALEALTLASANADKKGGAA